MSAKNDILKAKEAETRSFLEDWIKTCRIFSNGDRVSVHVELQLFEAPSVVVEHKRAETNRTPQSKNAQIRYEEISSNLTEEEWKFILECNLPRVAREILRFIYDRNNTPVDSATLREHWNTFSENGINLYLRKGGRDSFRLRRIGRSEKPGYLFQVFKVRRKAS